MIPIDPREDLPGTSEQSIVSRHPESVVLLLMGDGDDDDDDVWYGIVFIFFFPFLVSFTRRKQLEPTCM